MSTNRISKYPLDSAGRVLMARGNMQYGAALKRMVEEARTSYGQTDSKGNVIASKYGIRLVEGEAAAILIQEGIDRSEWYEPIRECSGK